MLFFFFLFHIIENLILLINLEPWFSSRGDFVASLMMSGDIFGCRNWDGEGHCDWHPGGGNQGSRGWFSTAKNYPAQSINDAEAKKPWFRDVYPKSIFS